MVPACAFCAWCTAHPASASTPTTPTPIATFVPVDIGVDVVVAVDDVGVVAVATTPTSFALAVDDVGVVAVAVDDVGVVAVGIPLSVLDTR